MSNLWQGCRQGPHHFCFFFRQIKNAAVATTTASGAAVNSSRITAVQSVYIAQTQNLSHHLSRPTPPPLLQ